MGGNPAAAQAPVTTVATTRLMLGSAQFGMPYGIANKAGLPDEVTVAGILERADDYRINAIDTAVAYQLAEERLGRWPGLPRWQVVTKLPPLPEGVSDVASWVTSQVDGSLQRLSLSGLHGLLLHQPMQLLDDDRGASLWAAMQAVQSAGKVCRIGYSVYSPEQLDRLWGRFPAQLVQAPFNVFDRRLLTSGWLTTLGRAGAHLHVRSVFLQGLLLLPRTELPLTFQKWSRLWISWHAWLRQQSLDPVTAALGFVLGQPGVDRVIVGVDSTGHLDQIVTAARAGPLEVPPDLACQDVDLLHPHHWRKPVRHAATHKAAQ